MRKKIVILMGVFALLIGINMQVNASNPADEMAGIVENKIESKHVGTQSIDEWMPDKNLQKVVAKEMGVSEVTQEALKGYTGKLVGLYESIENIKGLEYATNVVEIDLRSNSISDLTPLSKLSKLKKLYVDTNKIIDITPISGLQGLTHLSAYQNQISDLTPVSNLKNLNYLMMSNNAISDLKPLTNLKNLNYLMMEDNAISDLTPLIGKPKLQTIYLLNQKIKNEEISGYVGAKIVQKNNITDLSRGRLELRPGSPDGVYDRNAKLINWTFKDSGKREAISTFYTSTAFKFSGTVTQPIVVKDDLTSMEVKNSSLYIGDKWEAKDNFVKAIDKDGKAVELKDVTVEGTVDITKAGTNKVTYTIINPAQEKISKEATITVKADQTSIEVKDSSLYINDKWQAADNFVSATNQDGEAVDIKDISVEGSVDISKAGTNKVTYTILNHKDEKVSKDATITVKTDQTSIEVKNSTLYLNDKWTAVDNFVKATDKDGKAIGISDVSVAGLVNTSEAGVNQVTYTILNHKDEKVSKDAIITVKADETKLEIKNSTLYAGDTWKPADNVVKAVDQDGKVIDIKDITVEGSVDPTIEGIYKVKYTILNHVQEKISHEATITVKGDDLTTLEVKDSNLYFGDTWKAEDNLVKAIDKDGKAVDIKDITVEGSVDTSKEGINKVKYIILNHANEKISQEATITVKGNDLTSLEVKDSTLYFGDTWKPADNVVKAIDQDGQDIDIKDITVEGSVDPAVEGLYKVKYTILNHAKEKISNEASITVKGNDLTSLEVKDSQLYVGDKWQAEDNFVKAIDKDGKAVDIKGITVEGKADTSKEGISKVKYVILNHKNEKISKEATITVKADQTSIEVKDSQLYVGDKWNQADNLVKATDQDGKAIDIKDISVEGKVDITKVGSYKVMYTIMNHKDEKVSKEATITIIADQTSIEVKDSQLYINDKWEPVDNFVKATDKTGKAIDFKDVIVEGKADTSKEGVSKVTYTVLDNSGVKISKQATITVKKDQTAIEVKDTQLYVGDKWNQADNFVKATDKDGKAVDIKDITVEGKVDTTKAGVNKVTYTTLDHVKNKVSKVATVTIKDDQTKLEVKDSTLYAGDTWKSADNVVKAIDQDGKAIAIKDISVEGSVDPTIEGIYKVKYTILNHFEEKISQEATITVKGNDLTSIEVKDSTLYAGDTWKAADNLVKATDKDGKTIDIKDVSVEGNVDPTKEGIYKVKYTIINHSNTKISKEATITVKGNDLTSIEVKDSTLYFGDTWKAEDNLVKAIDKDGKAVDIKGVSVEGDVDTKTNGTYKVKYTILNHTNEKISKEATITVKGDDLTSIEVKDSQLYVGDKWNQADNFVKATDKDGKAVDIKDITVEGKVDTTKTGDNKVTYTILDHAKVKVSKVASVTIKADQTKLEVKDSTLYAGDTWKPADNVVKAIDQDGKAIDIKDISVEGNVDPTVEGSYKVKYTILNHFEEKITQEATITVKGNDLTALEVKGSTIYLNDQWNPQDNIVKAIDKDGKDIDTKDISVEGKVDTAREGEYQVKYTILNHKQEPLTKTIIVTVKADLTSLEVKDSRLYLNEKWSAADNLVKAIDKDGNDVGIENITVEGSVDATKEDTYKVTYTIVNHKNEKISQEATITVKGNDLTSLEVKDSNLYFGDTWKAEDNFVKANDQDGKSVSIDGIKVEGDVDTKTAGEYKVKYTILNHAKEEISQEATITVKGNDLTSIEVKNSTLYFGDTWKATDNLVKAIDKDGKAVDIKDIKVEGDVDTKTAGEYKVKYTILNHSNTKISKEATITVKGNDLTSIEVKDSTLYFGDTWKAQDNLVKAIDQDGKVIDIKDVKVEGDVDTKTAGEYKIKYTILNHVNEKISKEAKITVKGNDLTSIEVKDSTLYFGDTWKAQDNLVKAIDKDGKAVDIKDVRVEGDVDTKTIGAYKVKYTILNHAKEEISTEATITVKGNDLTSIEVKDSTLYFGETWKAQDNLVKATDKDGKAVDIKDITVEGSVDISKKGTYKVKYTILNHVDEKISKEATITVKGDDLTSLEVKDSTLYFGDRWQAADNFVKATDQDGKSVSLDDIKVEGAVDIKTAGEYPVKYTILNHAKEKITKVATITMKGHDLTYLEVEDSTLYLGDKWNPADNLIKARDKDGKELGIEDVIIEGEVNTSKAGTYNVTYALLNHRNEKLSNEVTITVKVDQTSIEVKDSKLYVNDQWNPADNLVNAIDQDGKVIDIKDVTVEGQVDTKEVGNYQVSYTILNHKKEKVSKEATISVKADQTSIEVKDSKLYISDTWNPEDNLIKAIDQDGQTIEFSNVQVDGEVDTTQVGAYQVIYTVLNHKKEKVSQAATVNVKVDQSSLIVKDSELYLDDVWNPADNIVEAIDQDGNIIDDIVIISPQSDGKEASAKVIVEGNIDTRKEGINNITYTIFDHTNSKITKDVAINVKMDKTSLEVKDTKIHVNDQWQPADNFVSALDQDGQILDISDVIVEGKVNTHKVGKYKVTYTISNHADKKISKKANIIVQANGNGSGSGNLPKTGYDMSIIGSLLGLAGVLGFGSLYLYRRENKE